MPKGKEIIDRVLSAENRRRIEQDKRRYKVYQGKLKDEIVQHLRKEFVLEKTVASMMHRIVPINITQKIINKLAMVYRESPERRPSEESEADQALIDAYVRSMLLNQKMKFANRYFKLMKHVALEPFVNRDGKPSLRVLPSHTYTPISYDELEPERPTAFVKHVRTDVEDAKEMRFHYWSDEQFLILDGEGSIVLDEMRVDDNQDGVNPYGKIPYVYLAENDDGKLIPIADDDLISMQFVISTLLTDLTYASKYQAWSIYVLTGVDQSQKVEMNPSAVLTLPEGASLDAIKANVDINQMLSQVETLVGMLLTTKNLSVGDISGQIQANSAASGVAKMIDRSETTEDRMDQEQYFINAERKLWDLLAHHMVPVWNDRRLLAEDMTGTFSPDFEIQVHFPDQKPHVSDKELIEIQIMKLDNGLTTKKRAIQEIYKDMTSEEVDQLLNEIEEDKPDMSALINGLRQANGERDDEGEDQDDDAEEDDGVQED
jgi:hypothetical protein